MHRLGLIALLSFLLTGCFHAKPLKDGPPRFAVNVHNLPNAVPRYEPKSRYGNPPYYEVNGKRYHVLNTAKGYSKRGIASWYGRKFNGQLTSIREPYNMLAMTAASPELPIPCYARITNLENGRSIVVRVNDRGPFAPNRIIDLSYAAAKKLGYAQKGTALVQVSAIDVAHPENSEPPYLAKTPKLYLQVGAFSHYAYAAKLQKTLAHVLNRPIRIQNSINHQQPIYRVQIGPLKGVGESDTLQKQLMQDGYVHTITVIS